MHKGRFGFGVLALVVVAVATPAVGGEEAAAPDMEAMMKLAQPGEHHEHMAQLVGTWKSHGRFWMQPGAPPQEADGSAEITPMLGGRFFHTRFKGAFMGMPFEGIGIDGFDNAKGKHIGMWVDSMGTMMMTAEGECEDGGKILRMVSEFDDPMSGARLKMKQVTTRVSNDELKYEAFMSGPDGQEFKAMEIVYTRQ